MVKVKVTKKHMAEAAKDTCLKCPVDLAVKEAFSATDVWTGYSITSIQKDSKLEKGILIPQSARDFIVNWDHNRSKCEPFEFELENPFEERNEE